MVHFLRRSQTAHRNQLPGKEAVCKTLIKVYPILAWSDDMMEHYLQRNAIAIDSDCYDPTKGE